MNLRPLSLGEILDRTAQLYRENFLLFAGISAVYAGVLLVLSLLQIGMQELLGAEQMAHRLQWLTWSFSGVSMLLAFIFAGAAVAANNRAVGWVHLGEPATIRGAYSSILPHLGRYMWLMTITAFRVWSPLVLLYAGYFAMIFLYARPMGLLGQPGATRDNHATLPFLAATAAFFILLIPAIIYAILMGLRYALAVPACVVENLKARQALRRSIELSKGSRGRIFLLCLLAISIQTGLILVTQMFFIFAAVQHHGVMSAGIRSLQQLTAFFTNTLVGPIYATGLTLFYYDQRVRKEGYDIEWMMQSSGLAAPAPEIAAPEAAPEPVALPQTGSPHE
jgi:hypothetical protein